MPCLYANEYVKLVTFGTCTLNNNSTHRNAKSVAVLPDISLA